MKGIKAMTVLKICINEWKNQSREKRELSVYRELGYETVVMAKGSPEQWFDEEDVDGFKVLRFSTRPAKKLPVAVNQVISLFKWAGAARKIRPDVISGHDLPGLLIGWMSTIGVRGKKPPMIYHSLEFELGRNAKRGAVKRTAIKYLERFLMKRCAFSIMVNDSIADEVQQIHRLKKRPVVVRSTPNRWDIDEAECAEIRRELLSGVKAENGFIVMYHGILTTMRGIEKLIELTAVNPNVIGFILGDGGEEYTASLHSLVQKHHVEDRVIFHHAVPLSDLWRYVGAADVSLIAGTGTAKSYYFGLPNKLFESIQALTPLLASYFPEMKRIIDEYQIGLTCDPEDMDAINECVERMRTDRAFYAQCKENLKRAKEDLCWENEKEILVKAFKENVLACT
jgi:glycosyltransferase involved in cell wall biosynthesis